MSHWKSSHWTNTLPQFIAFGWLRKEYQLTQDFVEFNVIISASKKNNDGIDGTVSFTFVKRMHQEPEASR